MGEASMRKWMSRARASLVGVNVAAYEDGRLRLVRDLRALALHMRLRERKRRQFWRNYHTRAHTHQLLPGVSYFEWAQNG